MTMAREFKWLVNSDTHQLVGRREFREFGHPSSCRSEQLVRTSALETARRSETEVIASMRPAPVRAEFLPRPIEQHEIMIDLDRQKPLVGRPHMQTPRSFDWGGNVRDWTGIGGRLEAADSVRDGRRN